MGYTRSIWASAVVILLLSSSGHASNPCYIVDSNGAEHWIASWNRLVVRQIEPRMGERDGDRLFGSLDSPHMVSSFIYQGAVIPALDLKFILPTLGLYALKDGHLIEANPLAESGFSKEHRFLDLEHQRHRSTAAGPEGPSRPDVLLLLEAFIEYSSVDTVVGYPVAEPGVIEIHDARIVVFEPKAIDEAHQLWTARMSEPALGTSFAPYVTRLGGHMDLRSSPGGKVTADLKRGAPVEVLEVREEWARVKVEGWVKREEVEGKDRDRP